VLIDDRQLFCEFCEIDRVQVLDRAATIIEKVLSDPRDLILVQGKELFVILHVSLCQRLAPISYSKIIRGRSRSSCVVDPAAPSDLSLTIHLDTGDAVMGVIL